MSYSWASPTAFVYSSTLTFEAIRVATPKGFGSTDKKACS